MKAYYKEHKLTLLRIALASLLVVSAMVMEKHNATVSLILYLFSYALAGCLIIFKGIVGTIKEKSIGEKLLMTVASIGAIAIGEYFEASLIVILFEIGELIEDLSLISSRNSVETLQSIRPERARLKGQKELTLAKDIKVGDIIEIYAGERIPLDGIVINGISSVDTSVMTGESLPVEVRPGSEVLSGCLNVNGVITVEVKRGYKQSAAQRIIDLSEGALDKKTKNEKFIKRFASIYTPIIIALSLFIALIPPFFDSFNFKVWAYRAFSMLAISCPCALVISVPLAYFCAIGYASKKGILIKGSSVLESLEKINTMAFDKTGTLTKAELHVTKIEACGNTTKIQLLEYLSIVELKSNHPVALAVQYEAKRFNIKAEEGENYKESSGYGVECDSKYGHIKAGSRAFVDAMSSPMYGTVYVSVNGEYVGYIGVGDELKENSKIAFDHLRKLGVNKKIILSGDKQSKVEIVASVLQAEGAYSELLPENKLDAIEDIIESTPNCRIAYCGDGINDLPSLARADVGIAMGAVGSDSAVEKSDVVIMDDDIQKVPLAIKIAKRAKSVVIQNITFAIVAKVALLFLSAFGILPMMGAVLGDVGIMVLTVLNSARSGR